MRNRFETRQYWLALLFLPWLAQADQFDIVGPPGSERFGETITLLPNGNFVVTDPKFDLQNPTVVDVGAVYLYSPEGVMISQLTGWRANDRVGSDGVTVLSNGNFVALSNEWNGLGAASWGSMTLGIQGRVNATNSLIGSPNSSGVGYVTPLAQGNYVVSNPGWSSSSVVRAGSVTWCNGQGGTVGEVSAANSLVGSHNGDSIGNGDSSAAPGIKPLRNGNYVVTSSSWHEVSAVTWGNGRTGTTGVVSAANSLVGSSLLDRVGGAGITELSNGNFVISSPSWSAIEPERRLHVGAATWVDGDTGISGVISAGNSLIGTSAYDAVGNDLFGRPSIIALSNGNYVVVSSSWDAIDPERISDVGAVTWGDGTRGTVGKVSARNSYVGTTDTDSIGTLDPGRVAKNIVALPNGNYVFVSSYWHRKGAVVGAVTWGNGRTGSVGPVSEMNSIVGNRFDDRVGYQGIIVLSNGNYVTASRFCGACGPDYRARGAVTWGDGTQGSFGVVSESNSLVGIVDGEGVGYCGVTPLTNGNYVVSSCGISSTSPRGWLQAATWVDGRSGISGIVSEANSLIGGGSITPLNNGNYVIMGNYRDVGAVTWGNGRSGTRGRISGDNSLIGSPERRIGYGLSVALSDGNYLVLGSSSSVTWGDGQEGTTRGVISGANSLLDIGPIAQMSQRIAVLRGGSYVLTTPEWNGAAVQAGAATWANRFTTGNLSAANSLIGSRAGDRVGLSVRRISESILAVESPYWQDTSGTQRGALTLFTSRSGPTGAIDESNSFLGVSFNYVYDANRNHVITAGANKVSIIGADVGKIYADGFE